MGLIQPPANAKQRMGPRNSPLPEIRGAGKDEGREEGPDVGLWTSEEETCQPE